MTALLLVPEECDDFSWLPNTVSTMRAQWQQKPCRVHSVFTNGSYHQRDHLCVCLSDMRVHSNAYGAHLSPVPERFHDFFHGFPMHFRTKRRVYSCHSTEHHFLSSGMWCPDLGSQARDTCEKYVQRSWHGWKTSLKKYATLPIANER